MPKWFKFFGAVLFLLIAAFAVTNAVFYGLQTDNNDPKAPITSSNATILMWINIVLALLSVFALIYFVMRIYKGDPEGENKKKQIVGYSEETGIGYSLSGLTPEQREAAEAQQDNETLKAKLEKAKEKGFVEDEDEEGEEEKDVGSTLSRQRKSNVAIREAKVEQANPNSPVKQTPNRPASSPKP